MPFFNNYPIEYDEPLFRPPAEANSLIFQATLGCSWNKCAFCEMYTGKKFRIRSIDEINKEIKASALCFPETRKFFLADGNALVLPYSVLLQILTEIKSSFAHVQRVSSYALPKDILRKSNNELKELRDQGLKLLYVGIESGDNELLGFINKGEDYNSTREGLLKAHCAGIDTSVMIIVGLGGAKYSHQHAINSALLVNEVQPKFLSVLTLGLPKGPARFQQRFSGSFEALSAIGILQELRLFVENTQLNNSIFRSDHISNMLVLKGNLGRDKPQFLKTIDRYLN